MNAERVDPFLQLRSFTLRYFYLHTENYLPATVNDVFYLEVSSSAACFLLSISIHPP